MLGAFGAPKSTNKRVMRGLDVHYFASGQTSYFDFSISVLCLRFLGRNLFCNQIRK